MKKRIGIVGHGSGLALHTAMMSVIAKQEVLEVVSPPAKNYKGNPFDKPFTVIKPRPILSEPKPIQPELFEEPKSKYINKPIRNYKR